MRTLRHDRSVMTRWGFDTETTGLFGVKFDMDGTPIPDSDPPRYCYPYLACFTRPASPSAPHEEDVNLIYTFPIDPTNRQVVVTDEGVTKCEEIISLFDNDTNLFVGHNVKFDVNMIRSICFIHGVTRPPSFWYDLLEYNCDDTTAMYHCLCSQSNLALKPLALLHAGISEADESDLKITIDRMRDLCKKDFPEVAIATLYTCPTLTSAPKRGWYILDTWLCMIEFDNPIMAQLATLAFEQAVHYCQTDVARTLVLHTLALEKLGEHGFDEYGNPNRIDCYDQNRLSLTTTFRIEDRGITINMERVREKLVELREAADEQTQLVSVINDSFFPKPKLRPGLVASFHGINPGSSKQVAELLHGRLKLPIKYRTDKGSPSTKVDYLVDYLRDPSTSETARQAIRHIIANSRYNKACSMLFAYLKKALCVDRDEDVWSLFPSYNDCGTASLRLSSTDPNGQQVSKGGQAFEELIEIVEHDISLREIFMPRAGREWFSVDYVQLQLVIFAVMSGDESMIEAVKRGDDFHHFMACKIFETQTPTSAQRRVAKAVNFGFLFGAGKAKVKRTARMDNLFALLQELFPTALQNIEHNRRMAESRGFVYTKGRYPLYPDRERPHSATNYIIQGTEGELVKTALYTCSKYLEDNHPSAYIPITVHDEIIFDFPVGEGQYHINHLTDLMVTAGTDLGLPLRVDVKYIAPKCPWDKGVPYHEAVA